MDLDFGFGSSGGASNIDVLFNSVLEGSANATIPLNVNLTDGVSDIVPTSVGLTGNDLDIVIPTPIIPSGVLFKTIEPTQYTSYRNRDEGWRVQNGFFNYVPPTNPKAIAELDFSQINFFNILKDPLVVNGISSTTRFVDVDGTQVFNSVGNKNLVVIDKLTGMMYQRVLPFTLQTWNTWIDGSASFTLTVNGVVYSDWFVVSFSELFNIFNRQNNQRFVDLQTSVSILTGGLTANFTSTTDPFNTSNCYLLGDREIVPSGKASALYTIHIRNARNLITAP
jgi:hypothetical protein